MKRLLLFCAAVIASLLNAPQAHAFSGEDPVLGHPWYHEKLTVEAAAKAGFTNQQAIEAIAWHADYIDSYLYNPVWWGQGGLNRYKVSRATQAELEKCHFDDLFSTEQVNAMWRRYASGAFAGLMWAKERNDVHAAQNIVGVSLHAMQDFYAHSSWVDKAERRTKTYFQLPRAQRSATNLYTGAYEIDHQHGVKSHGKWIPQDTVWGQPGVKQIMEIACDPISPFSNSDSCAAWKAVKAGTPMTPTVANIQLPKSIMVYTPAGIALDNTWVADESLRQRGIAGDFVTDANSTGGKKAFDMTYQLALDQSAQWLQTLERAMAQANASDFWQKVKTTPASAAQREAQYERYNQFPYTFMSAGEYPPKNPTNAQEWFLRVRIKTAKGRTAGTNADVQLRAGGKVFDLDYLPKTMPVLAYDDFEAGDDDIYVVGPFAQCPPSFDLINNAATGREITEALGRDFVNGISSAWNGIGESLFSLVGGHADKVAVNKTLWMPQDLADIPGGGKAFSIDLNGGKEGIYRVDGTIYKVGEDEQNVQVAVRLDKLVCIKESTWDRGSTEDEPFLLSTLNPFPGQQQEWLSPVYTGVDSGETRDVRHEFGRVQIPKGSGMLNLAITLMESDDEKEADRKKLLQAFAGTLDEHTKEAKRNFLEALSTSMAAEWKVEHLEVTAWTRNGQIRQGRVFDQAVNRWVKPKVFETFHLNTAAAKDTLVSTDDLLPELSESGQPTHDASPVPTTPETPVTPVFDLTTWVDEWDTTYGRVKLELADGVLKGRLYIYDERTGGQRESDRLELSAGTTEGALVGNALYTGVSNPVTLQLSADGNAFTGTSGRNLTDQWSGKRRRSAPTTPTIPSVPITPGTPTGQMPSIPVVSGGGTGGMRALGEWSVQIESMRVAREKQVEIVATYKNTTRRRVLLGGGEIDMVLTDGDGVGIRNIGTLYQAGGDPDMEPERITGQTPLEAGEMEKVLVLFDIPRGNVPFKTLTIFGRNSKPLVFNASGLPLIDSVAPVSMPIQGASGGDGSFAELGDFSLRFDGVRRGRNNALQMFITVKNIDPNKQRWLAHPAYSLGISVLTDTGAEIRGQGNIFRASGATIDLAPIKETIVLVPDGEATVCYPVSLPKGTFASQLRVKFKGQTLTYNLPQLP